jgi:hypothetical protein
VADIRYVVVSDLHFGAENSLLTSLIEVAGDVPFRSDPCTPSPVVRGLVEAVRALAGHQERPPTLVLAGDILDLGLSPASDACEAFSGFAQLAFGTADPVFAPVVYYLPGNHDHHLWEAAREDQYVDHLRSAPAGQPLRAPIHVTGSEPDREQPLVTSAWMANLVGRAPSTSAVEVRVAYPNMALCTPDQNRMVVLSHGHFTEPIYALMSTIKDVLYPAERSTRPADVATLEQENFAWIDFLWSTLGQSGQVGVDMGRIYAGRATPAALSALVSRLVRALLVKGKGPSWLHNAEGAVIDAIVTYEMSQHVRTERGTAGVTLSARGRAGLEAYLAGAVRAQLTAELGAPAADLTFVFGHTHKPFVERWPVSGYPAPVGIVNTGGWVVDTPIDDPVQGAVVALVDDALEVAALQVYRQGPGPLAGVRLLGPVPGDGSPGAFWNELRTRIDPAAAPWADLGVACRELVEERHRLQQALTAGPWGRSGAQLTPGRRAGAPGPRARSGPGGPPSTTSASSAP